MGATTSRTPAPDQVRAAVQRVCHPLLDLITPAAPIEVARPAGIRPL
jgi:hypothetical protein